MHSRIYAYNGLLSNIGLYCSFITFKLLSHDSYGDEVVDVVNPWENWSISLIYMSTISNMSCIFVHIKSFYGILENFVAYFACWLDRAYYYTTHIYLISAQALSVNHQWTNSLCACIYLRHGTSLGVYQFKNADQQTDIHTFQRVVDVCIKCSYFQNRLNNLAIFGQNYGRN